MKIRTGIILSFVLLIQYTVYGQTPCENGQANGYDCNMIDLQSHLSNQELAGEAGIEANDIWGWTDPQTGKEYALFGMVNGIVFVDISNPVNPVIIGRLPSETGNSSNWRDIKTNGTYAFVVADNNFGHGMQVFDLSRLRNYSGAIETYSADAVYSGVGSAHNVFINTETDYAYIVGARGASEGCGQGGLHIVDVSDPLNPRYAGCFDADGYTHDTQCVIYKGPDAAYQGREICFNSNENTITIANVTNKSNTTLISKEGYPFSAYAHQGWLTEDHRFFISNDELDESSNGLNTRTLIWDVSDLDNPILVGQYKSERNSIDHNLYVKNNKIYQANYTTGLIVLDGSQIEAQDLREIGYFDTYNQSNSTSFSGAWSNYPFFESGNIIVSDINNGLFVLKPNFREVISVHPIFSEGCGADSTLNVTLNPGEVASSYQWQKVSNATPLNLNNSSIYTGVNSDVLTINFSELPNWEQARFRCKIELESGEVVYSYISNSPSGLPEVNFSFTINDQEVTFTSNTINADSISWDFGDGSPASNQSEVVYSYNEIGVYNVTLSAFNECGTVEQTQQLDLEAILSSAQQIVKESVYPNPIQHYFKLKTENPDQVRLIQVIDQHGRIIYFNNEKTSNAERIIRTQNWESGMYLLKVFYNNDRFSVTKLIKK